MNRKGRIVLKGVAACFGLLFFISQTYAADVVITRDYTDVGTIVFVSPSPGDSDTANGTALLNALNGITDNGVANRYLIKLGPGTYNLGSNSLLMKQYVSIEGAGETATTITSAVSGGSFPPPNGTITGVNDCELRFLTVENTGAGSYVAAIFNSSASPSIIHVTATASAGSTNYGVLNYSSSSPIMKDVTAEGSTGSNSSYGVMNHSASAPTLVNVSATGSGAATSNYGIFNNSASPKRIMNVTAEGTGGSISYGIYSTAASTVKINHSILKGTTAAVYSGTGATTRVGSSQLDGGPVAGAGVLTCAGVYDENFAFSADTCP